MNKKLTKNLLSLMVLLSVAYFFIDRLRSNWANIEAETNLTPSVWSLAAILLFVSAVVVSGLLWKRVLLYVDSNIELDDIEAVRVHSGAWLLKYIPGQAGAVMYKVTWAQKNNFKKQSAVVSFILENLYLTIASLAIPSILLLLYEDYRTSVQLLLISAAVASMILVFSSKVLSKFIKATSSKIKKINIENIGNYSFNHIDTIKFSLMYLAPRAINGLGFVAVSASLFSAGIEHTLPLISAYTVAGIVGIYAIFVPSGIGVREAVIVALVGPIIGIDQAILLSLVARLYATISDGVLALVYFIIYGKMRGIKA